MRDPPIDDNGDNPAAEPSEQPLLHSLAERAADVVAAPLAQLRQRLRPGFLAGLLVALHLGLVLDVAARHSATYDEPVYLATGYAYWTEGIPNLYLNPGHPPLLKYWLALPLLGETIDVEQLPGWADPTNEANLGFAFMFRSGRDPVWLLYRARCMAALLSAMLAVGVYLVARRLAGVGAALFALALYAFDPLIVGHAALATLDVGSAALLFFAAVALPVGARAASFGRLVAVGLLIGAAMAAKVPALVLLPILALLTLYEQWRRRRADGADSARRSPPGLSLISRLNLVFVAAAAVIGLVGREAGLSFWVDSAIVQVHHATVGEPCYAFGHFGSGWLWYLPAAWLVKTPLPLLVLTSIGAVVLVGRLRTDFARVAPLLLTPLLCGGGYWLTGLNLGVRYWILAVPFLAVGASLGYAWAARWRGGRLLALGCLGWLVAGTLWVHPDQIAYANEASGGPARLWRSLADSNVDWGQSLPALEREVTRQPLRRLYLSYFGTADPAAYDLRYTALPPSWDTPFMRWDREAGPDPDGREWLAISVNHLLGLYNPQRRRAWAWLRERPMTAFPGYSIALYDITDDAGAQRALGESLLSLDEPELALVPLGRALELAPGDRRAAEAWARAAARLGGDSR